MAGTIRLDQAALVVSTRRRQEMLLLVAWQDALAALEVAVTRRDRLAAGQERAVCVLLGMTPTEVKWARRHARIGRCPATAASRLNYATFVHRREQVEEVEARWAERIAAAQVPVDEAATALCEATRALLTATTARTVEELTGYTRRQLAGLAKRAASWCGSAC